MPLGMVKIKIKIKIKSRVVAEPPIHPTELSFCPTGWHVIGGVGADKPHTLLI